MSFIDGRPEVKEARGRVVDLEKAVREAEELERQRGPERFNPHRPGRKRRDGTFSTPRVHEELSFGETGLALALALGLMWFKDAEGKTPEDCVLEPTTLTRTIAKVRAEVLADCEMYDWCPIRRKPARHAHYRRRVGEAQTVLEGFDLGPPEGG